MQQLENRFYVYEHLRSDTGAIFYVGKGAGNRCNVRSRHHRNIFWQRVARKAGGFSVRKVVNNVDEELAFLVEQERISQLRALGFQICNLTEGGDGTSGWVKSEEWRKKVGVAHRGKTVSLETRAKISASLTGFRHTGEAKANMSASKIGMQNTLGHKHSNKTKLKMSAAHIGNKSRLGQTRSLEERAKASAALKGKPQAILVCPHCQKSGGNTMRRYHFDNCKVKP